MNQNLTKRENAADLVLILMISALVTLLVTRYFLQLFGWPTISFGVWHIAHANWGGMLMVIGSILMLVFHGEKIRKTAAIISGMGWGLFIDEVGKYITKDNNYWFQPAIIIIYISFIILYLIYRHLEINQPKDTKTLLYAAFSNLEDAAEKDLSENEKRETVKNLEKVIKHEKDLNIKNLASELKLFFEKQKTKKINEHSWWRMLIAKTGYYSYNKFFKTRLVTYGLTVYACVWAIDKIQETVRILINPQRMQMLQKFSNSYDLISKSDFYMMVGKIFFDSVTAVFFVMGIFFIVTKKKFKGLRFFQMGLIVGVFLSSVFKLYFEQFSEVWVLMTSIILFFVISKMKKEISA
ncbi:MAG: hypothetical protein PHS06_01430 [Candidatus Shapirobacteria bacterium]|nr:hypothetical protein [Candidatus Shapirobacteria bacterium]